MNKLHFLYLIVAILCYSCTENPDKAAISSERTTEEKVTYQLYDCDYEPTTVFPEMTKETNMLPPTDTLLNAYKIVTDSLILNWDSLVAAENNQVKHIARVLERLELHPAFNRAKLDSLQKALCLVNSNRVPADQLNDSIRLSMFDNLLEQLKIEASSLVLDLANIPLSTANEEDQYLDQDRLLAQLKDTLLVESIYTVEDYDKIIFINSQLYMEAVSNYNHFVQKHTNELKERGVKKIYYFPGFYE